MKINFAHQLVVWAVEKLFDENIRALQVNTLAQIAATLV